MFRTSVFILLCLSCLGSDLAQAAQPNILFIAVDDLKPVLGCYGDATAVTPNIDGLARRGTVFLNAQCQWPVCGPSRASLMTSLRPEATGVMNLSTSMRAKDPNVLTLPQHFRNCGYATAGAGKIYDPRCVDDKKTLDEPSWSVPFAKLPYHKTKFSDEKRFSLAPDVADDDLTDGQIALSGLKLMRELSKSDQPFFLAVGFKKPHLPFVAPRKYWDIYQRSQFELASHRGGIKDASGYSIHDSKELRGYGGIPQTGPILDELQLEAIHGYYACTSYVDAQIGRLLNELKRLNLDDNTAIVLWGDHGFHLGDHNMFGKHSTLEQAARVPLVICPPSGKTAVGTTKSPVEFTDIFPTLCDLAGLEIPDGIAGRSLHGMIDGSTPAVREGAVTVFKARGCIAYSYRTEQYRFTQWINKFNKVVAEELYDYDIDPLETTNFADDPSYEDVRVELSQAMRDEATGCDRLVAIAQTEK